MSRPISPITIAVQSIAARTGLTHKYLRQLHKDGMPIDNIESALAWLDARPDQQDAGDGASVGELRKARLELLRLQTARAELDLAIQRGEYVAIAQVNADASRIGSAIRASLLALENKIPSACLGLPINRSTPICKAIIRETLKLLSEESPTYWKADASSK